MFFLGSDGITGKYWSDCRIVEGDTLLDDPVIARRLWAVAARTVDAVAPTGVVKLMEYYRTADEEERLNLYLEHRHLRPTFSAIDEDLASG